VRLDHLLSKETTPHLEESPELITRYSVLHVSRRTRAPARSHDGGGPSVLSSVLRERLRTLARALQGNAGLVHRIRSASLRLRPVGLKLLENCIASTSIFVLPSYKKPTVDALAPSTDEGRGWPRKATGSCRPSVDPWMSEWGNPAPVMGCHSHLNT
jgi:hypothetical protein